MKKLVFLFVGIVLIIVGIIVSQSGGGVTINKRVVDSETAANAKLAVGGGVAGLGLLFLVIGIVVAVRGNQQNKRKQTILTNGVTTEGTVTFVDKDFSLLVNQKPIYSIVEYSFKDQAGNTYTRKVKNINSDMVIRMQIQVGSKVPVKYSLQNPSESVLILPLV